MTKHRRQRSEQGAFVVEFALLITLFLLLLIGIFEVGRMLYTLNAAVEAARRGARTAAVVSMHNPLIYDSMRQILPRLSDSQVVISYLPGNCTPATCQFVAVGLQNLEIQPIFIPLARLPVPSFTTTLPREGLGLS